MFWNYCGKSLKIFSMLCVGGDVWRFRERKQNQLFLLLSFLSPWSFFNVSVWKYKMPSFPVNKYFTASCACIFIFTNSKEKIMSSCRIWQLLQYGKLSIKKQHRSFYSFFFFLVFYPIKHASYFFYNFYKC